MPKPDRPMTIELDVQIATSFDELPDESEFRRWSEAVLKNHPEAILTLRLVDEEESRDLNARFRQQDKPTNVLSFPAELPPEINIPFLGDMVICAPLVAAQAAEQGKAVKSHWAHLTVHGILHLLGYDHIEVVAAYEMETLEKRILEQLGFPDPYE